MSRFPPQTREELSDDAQREFYDFMDKFSKKYFDESVYVRLVYSTVNAPYIACILSKFPRSMWPSCREEAYTA